jgi:hypothetical protein
MPAGGALTIRTLQKNDVVRLELSNTGAGLKAESATRMFTPYDIAKQGQAPTVAGLGLATVLAIVNDHGGRVRVDSAPGAGTTFRVEFMAALPAAVSVALPAAFPVGSPPTALPAALPATISATLPVAIPAAPAAALPETPLAEPAAVAPQAVAPVVEPAATSTATTGPTTSAPGVTSGAAPVRATRGAGALSLFDFALNISSEAADKSLSAALAETGAWEPKRELPEIPESQPAEPVREG